MPPGNEEEIVMDQEQILKVREALGKQGITFKADGTGLKQKDISTASVVASTMGIDLNEYIDAEKKLRATTQESADIPAFIPNCYSRKQFVHPILDDAQLWGTGDRTWFGTRFMFARDRLDGAPVMFIKMTATKYSAVPLMSSKSQMRAVISSILSNSEPSHEGYQNLLDELTNGIDKSFAYVLARFKAKELKTADDLARELLQWVPSSMIRTYPIQMTVKATAVGESTYSVPEKAYFAKDGVKVDAVTHLVEHFDMLAGIKELCLPGLPEIYSNDSTIPALHCLNLDDIAIQGPHPTWDEYFARFRPEEAQVIRAFIWSIFDANNNSRQLLYIEDRDGFSAKSVFMRVLTKNLGNGLVAAIQKDSLSNQFGLAKLWDKRLVYIGDNKNPNLIRSEKMHMLLGGDLADIEQKGKESFTAKLNAKVIASGNISLDIDPHARHERTRIIVVKPHVTDELMKKFVQLDENGNIVRDREGEPQFLGDNSFEPRLDAEFKAMMWDAREDYKRLCPTGSSIVLPDFMIEDLYNMSSSELDAVDEIVERYFVIGEKEYTHPGDLRREFNKACDALDADVKFDDFLVHIAKKYKVSKKSYRPANCAKVYVGIGINSMGIKEVETDAADPMKPNFNGLV